MSSGLPLVFIDEVSSCKTQLNYKESFTQGKWTILTAGAFGKIHTFQGLDYIIKTIPDGSIHDNEPSIHLPLVHSGIVHVTETFEYRGDLCIVMERCSQDLLDFLLGSEQVIFPSTKSSLYIDISVEQRLFLVYQLMTTVAWLHEGDESVNRKPIAHMDFKPENILFNKYGCLKICDFGLATTQESSSELNGTQDYAAPELLNSTPNRLYDTRATDIFSLGIVLFIIMTGCHPSRENKTPFRPYGNIQYYTEHMIQKSANMPKAIWSIFEAMTQELPINRPTATLIVNELDKHDSSLRRQLTELYDK
jgi:serine/threonine protein kinase